MIMRVVFAVSALTILCATDAAPDTTIATVPALAAAQPTDRFRIYQSPITTRDTFLLNTSSGRVWQLRQYGFLQGDPLAWDPLPRIDSERERARFIGEHVRKHVAAH